MATVRIKQGLSSTVRNPETGMWEPLVAGTPFEDDDEFVKSYPWAFESDVEQATAAPGEKRTVSRKKRAASTDE